FRRDASPFGFHVKRRRASKAGAPPPARLRGAQGTPSIGELHGVRPQTGVVADRSTRDTSWLGFHVKVVRQSSGAGRGWPSPPAHFRHGQGVLDRRTAWRLDANRIRRG